MNRFNTGLRMRRTLLPDSIPLVGGGGILSGADAAKKMAAGAMLAQCYTGLIYRGPALIGECVEAIRRRKEAQPRQPPPPVSPAMTDGHRLARAADLPTRNTFGVPAPAPPPAGGTDAGAPPPLES